MSKRNGYISWDEYFMGVALLASQRSKDPSTQVGACIVNDDNRIMSVGYNGFPRGAAMTNFLGSVRAINLPLQNILMFAMPSLMQY